MLQSRLFIERLFRHSSFTSRILSVVVDEAHCISHWGADFRKKYGTLGIIRPFLPRGAPFVAMSATLTRRVRRDIESKLHFRDSSFINEGNEHSNISLIVRACEHPMDSYRDLDFVLPKHAKVATDIPKMWIYVDNIRTGGEIIDHLTNMLRDRYPLVQDSSPTIISSLDSRIIRLYNAVISSEYRIAAMEAFRKGSIRIMVCTEAAGMVRTQCSSLRSYYDDTHT